MSVTAAPTDCPACGNTPKSRLTLTNGAPLRQCPACKLAWWDWPPFDVTAFYDQTYFQSERSEKGYDDYASLEPGVRRTARTRLARLAGLRRKFASRLLADGRAPRLLEIGCGTGCFLDEAVKQGWDADGIEVSEYAAAQAVQRGLAVVCGPIEDIDVPSEEYDCVALWDVIEHVRDPRQTIRTAAAALKRGGLLALSTGDITSWCARVSGRRWHLFNLPEHLYFFSPRSLELLLAAAGCRLIETIREVNWVPVAYLAERLAKPLGLATTAARRLRGLRWVVPATLRDVIGVYAVRI
jgi:SAM-dependent methyltransferase